MVLGSLIMRIYFKSYTSVADLSFNLTHLFCLLIHVNRHDINIYFRFRPHQWDLLLHFSALIIHPEQAVFQYGSGREKGEGNKRTKGGGRQGDREAERLPFISETYFFALQ